MCKASELNCRFYALIVTTFPVVVLKAAIALIGNRSSTRLCVARRAASWSIRFLYTLWEYLHLKLGICIPYPDYQPFEHTTSGTWNNHVNFILPSWLGSLVPSQPYHSITKRQAGPSAFINRQGPRTGNVSDSRTPGEGRQQQVVRIHEERSKYAP